MDNAVGTGEQKGHARVAEHLIPEAARAHMQLSDLLLEPQLPGGGQALILPRVEGADFHRPGVIPGDRRLFHEDSPLYF